MSWRNCWAVDGLRSLCERGSQLCLASQHSWRKQLGRDWTNHWWTRLVTFVARSCHDWWAIGWQHECLACIGRTNRTSRHAGVRNGGHSLQHQSCRIRNLDRVQKGNVYCGLRYREHVHPLLGLLLSLSLVCWHLKMKIKSNNSNALRSWYY